LHPYGDNSDLTWTLTNPDEEAAYSRLHFRRLETENGFDFVNVKDGNGNVIQPFSGAYAGFWSVAVPGRTVQVQLVSDYIYPAWGFCVDQIETTPPPPPCLAESPHPYSDNSNETWTVTNPDEEATFSRIHFSRLETESGFDLVNVKDGNGNVIQPFSGAYAGGVWSIKVPGRTVQIQLVSDFVYAAWGFCVDQIETLPPPDIDVPLTPIVALLGPGRSTAQKLRRTKESPLDKVRNHPPPQRKRAPPPLRSTGRLATATSIWRRRGKPARIKMLALNRQVPGGWGRPCRRPATGSLGSPKTTGATSPSAATMAPTTHASMRFTTRSRILGQPWRLCQPPA
jgi:hypothetical protein